jgi:hypothetical protein
MFDTETEPTEFHDEYSEENEELNHSGILSMNEQKIKLDNKNKKLLILRTKLENEKLQMEKERIRLENTKLKLEIEKLKKDVES